MVPLVIYRVGFMSNDNVDNIEKIIDEEVNNLKKQAESICSMFWEHQGDMPEVRTKTSLAILGCRVRSSKNGFSISWFYWSFYKKGNKTRRTNNHIKKPASKHSYSMKKLLAKALPNEAEMVELCEAKFSEIRERVSALIRVKHSLHYYKKIIAENTVEKDTRKAVIETSQIDDDREVMSE